MPDRTRWSAPKASAPKRGPIPRLEPLSPAYFFAPDLEREINGLEGVTSARVISTGTAIDEIHVIAPRDRAPKKVVRDIESLLLVRFGIRIDHRCISIVQSDRMRTTLPQNSRPNIQQILSADGMVRVSLAVGDNVITGQAESNGPEKELMAVARAVIQAVEKLLQTPGVLTVLKTRVSDLDDYQIALVLVRWVFADQIESLIGASLVHDNVMEAAARATLDAINRRLVRFQNGL